MAADMPLFYHGAISKKDCEELMGKKNKDGAYLIRDSETIAGALCLCVFKKPVVYTYRILKTLSGQYALVSSVGAEEIYYKSLDDLVQNYKRKRQGLVMHLRHAIKRKTALMIQAATQKRVAICFVVITHHGFAALSTFLETGLYLNKLDENISARLPHAVFVMLSAP
uniref:SH2 domain-containing protein n=1 Tax=Knipowitschia caucasica TaxID=637954 RepID=A0AAV2L7C1_KNICA